MQIVGAVAEHYGIPTTELLGRSRLKRTAEARHVAMGLIRQRTGASFPELGRLFSRDHSTTFYGVSKAKRCCGDAMATIGRLLDLDLDLEPVAPAGAVKALAPERRHAARMKAAYAAAKAAGRCVHGWCQEPRSPGVIRCARHMQMVRDAIHAGTVRP